MFPVQSVWADHIRNSPGISAKHTMFTGSYSTAPSFSLSPFAWGRISRRRNARGIAQRARDLKNRTPDAICPRGKVCDHESKAIGPGKTRALCGSRARYTGLRAGRLDVAILCPPVRAIARPYAASFLTDSITTKLQVRHSKHLNSGLVATRVIGVLHFLQFIGLLLL